MKKRILHFALLMLAAALMFASCTCTEHSYGEWETQTEATCAEEGVSIQKCSCGAYNTRAIAKTEAHAISNGKCSVCGLSATTVIGGIIKQNPDQYDSGCYMKSYLCSDFSSKDEANKCILMFTYDESDESLEILFSKSDFGTDTIIITIEGGVIAKNYPYRYLCTNIVGGFTDQIDGVFTAAALSDTSGFSFSDYRAGSGGAFEYFYEDYQKDAAKYAKLLVEYLDEFLADNSAGFDSSALNFN